MKTKKEIEAEAKAALNSLPNKKGWTTRVWENLGWCWALENGPISVFPSTLPGHFHCLIAPSIEERGCGAGEWTASNTKKRCKTAWEAVVQEVEIVRQHIVEQTKRYAELSTEFDKVMDGTHSTVP